MCDSVILTEDMYQDEAKTTRQQRREEGSAISTEESPESPYVTCELLSRLVRGAEGTQLVFDGAIDESHSRLDGVHLNPSPAACS